MKTLTIILFLASGTLNVCLFTGCRTLHDVVYGNNPCKFCEISHGRNNDDTTELARIAGLLDIKTSGKTASDLSSDIRYKLDCNVEVPNVFNPEAFEKMAKKVNSETEKAMREYQSFISGLQGKRVIVIDPEEK